MNNLNESLDFFPSMAYHMAGKNIAEKNGYKSTLIKMNLE